MHLFFKMNYLGHDAESTLHCSIVLHARYDRFGTQKYMLGQSEHSYLTQLVFLFVFRFLSYPLHLSQGDGYDQRPKWRQ
jgi:hypothetical protein